MSAQWMSVYQHKIPEPGEDVETEEAADAICEDHFGNERFSARSKSSASTYRGYPLWLGDEHCGGTTLPAEAAAVREASSAQ